MSGSDGTLARVTYLPGVRPPSEPSANPLVEPNPRVESSPRVEPNPWVELVETSPTDSTVRIDAEAEDAVEQSARAENISMHALARRGISSREMADLLASRELSETAVAQEVARLEGAGLLDDGQLAANLVRTLRERKGLGRSAISAELRRRKIDGDIVGLALDAIDGDDELHQATEIAVKRAAQLRSYDRETAERRLGGFLMRRGYGGSIVSAAVAAALGPKGQGGRSGSGPRFE